MTGDLLSLAGTILTLIAVIVLAWVCTRLVGRGMTRAVKGTNLEVIEELRLRNDKELAIVKAGGRNLLIGISQNGISLITELEGELESKEPGTAALKTASFAEAIKRLAAKKKEDEDVIEDE